MFSEIAAEGFLSIEKSSAITASTKSMCVDLDERTIPAMTKAGRNDPCPCGSGLKHKRCCLKDEAGEPRFTREDRLSARARLDRFSKGVVERERNQAFEEFLGESWHQMKHLDQEEKTLSAQVFDMWFWLDRPLDDGRLVVERLLEEDLSLEAGERRYLALARDTCMRLCEVITARPSVSLTLMDVLDGKRVTVREQMGSCQLEPADLVAVRVIPSGISGRPEIESGLLTISSDIQRSLVPQLAAHRDDFHRNDDAAQAIDFHKVTPPFYHSAWLSSRLDPPSS